MIYIYIHIYIIIYVIYIVYVIHVYILYIHIKSYIKDKNKELVYL